MFQKGKLEFAVLATIYIAFTCIYNYFDSIYIILGIISNLEMTESILEDVCRLYANTTSFYIRKLRIHRFEHLKWAGVLDQIPCG